MKAADVKCPMGDCGARLVDVAPEHDFANKGHYPRATESVTWAHCATGHVVEVRTKFNGQAAASPWRRDELRQRMRQASVL